METDLDKWGSFMLAPSRNLRINYLAIFLRMMKDKHWQFDIGAIENAGLSTVRRGHLTIPVNEEGVEYWKESTLDADVELLFNELLIKVLKRRDQRCACGKVVYDNDPVFMLVTTVMDIFVKEKKVTVLILSVLMVRRKIMIGLV